MDDRFRYEQAIQTNRYFLNWRQGLLAAYFGVLYGVGNLVMQACDKAPRLSWAFLAIGALIGVAFALAEKRNRECYYRAAQVAKAIELGDKHSPGSTDLFHKMEEHPSYWPKQWIGPHSLALYGTYLGTAAFMAVTSYSLYINGNCK